MLHPTSVSRCSRNHDCPGGCLSRRRKFSLRGLIRKRIGVVLCLDASDGREEGGCLLYKTVSVADGEIGLGVDGLSFELGDERLSQQIS